MKKLNMPPTYFYTGILLVVLIRFLFRDFNLIRFPCSMFGLVLVFLGVWLNFAASSVFKTNKTRHDFGAPRFLLTGGVFRFSRNPMYLGMFFFLAGLAVCVGNVLGLGVPLVFIIAVQLVFVPYEEKLMERRFGKRYVEYKKKVRRWI
ncbi:isoprenylcysteine carboxylmethyltransferase family protein [Candidatus Woesearchaeota archaeon]|nr:isoprenylcysteine carboxylmethyltransferase family protein [Candidatus Woesearchaeota archaeon]